MAGLAPALARTEAAASGYERRRGQLETYFDRTAAANWARMTSDAPLGRIRATVRAGRTRMRDTLLSWLPADLHGRRILDAGCGTGALAVELAHRGADVLAIDLAATLLDLARDRLPTDLAGSVDFVAGDMLRAPGRFDHVVAMDSLIHYEAADMAAALAGLCAQSERSVLATFAPRTPALSLMHAAGRLFPRADRAPAIEPVSPRGLFRRLDADPALSAWRRARTERISGGFYTSQALELAHAPDLAHLPEPGQAPDALRAAAPVRTPEAVRTPDRVRP